MSTRDRVEALYPLSPSQTGMWLQSQGDQGAGLFVEQTAFRLDGPLNRHALQRALQFVVDRHAALRSAIVSKGSEPMRAVLRTMPVVIQDADAPREDEEAALAALMARERARGFPLNRPPLIRFALLRIDEHRAWLVLSFHHIIVDGWSLVVLWKAAERFYAAEVAGEAVTWPPAPSDDEFAAWLSARSPKASEAFWRSRLAGFTTPSRITTTPADGATGDPEEFEHHMSREAGAALSAVAEKCRVSPAVVLEVLWAAVIAGRTRATDVAFAATVSGRPGSVPDIERMVGCFINTVPIRIRFDEAATLRQCLVNHQQQRADQAEFEYCSAGQIHGWSDVPAGQPLCDSLMVYENLQSMSGRAGESPVAGAPPTGGARVRGARTAYPLTILISPGTQPHLRVIYQPACLERAAARELAVELERLIVQSRAMIDAPVRDLYETLAFVPATAEAQRTRAAFVAPRSRLEQQLAAIWARLFQRTDIGMLDDFFSLGGHSLMALQMAAEVRATLGIDLPLHVLIAGPTIEGLAQACATRVGSGDDEALIPIAAGGAGMPVFCVHPLGGHVLCYAALGQRLAARHPVWGLQAIGLRHGERPAATWDEIVDHHWALLLEAQSRMAGASGRVDHVALVGYSYGGYISMELAARAYRLGATRVPVILLDVPHPSVVPETLRHPDRATLLHALFGAALGLDLDAFQRMPGDTMLREVYDLAVRRHLLPPDASLEQLARALDVAEAHSRLQPPLARYAFSVTLLRARDGADRISTRPDLGWRDYTDGLTVEWVDGRHETMLEAQHVDGVAALILRK
jgi:thioesterase domain-containing protein